MSDHLTWGHPEVPEILHHPHYRGHYVTTTGATVWTLAEFEGTEPDPGDLRAWPEEITTTWHGLMGTTPEEVRAGLPAFGWVSDMWREASRRWLIARRRRAVGWVADQIGEVAQDYRTAAEAVHTAWVAVEEARDTRFQGAVLRLRAAHADLTSAATELDEAAAVALRGAQAQNTKIITDERLSGAEIRTAMGAPGALGWPLGPLEDYQGGPEGGAQRPAQAQATEIITGHCERLADTARVLGLAPSGAEEETPTPRG